MGPFPALAAPPDPALGTALPELLTDVPGPEGGRWIDVLADHECPAITARRARRAEATGVGQDPVVWERARGSNVWDPDGNRYVDLTGGFGVCSAGHGSPFVMDRVKAQLDQLVHGLGDAFPGRVRIELSRELARLLPGDLSQVIFASGGAEAVDAALKTAVIATGRSRIVAFEGGYHGLTLGVLPMSHYRPGFRAPFEGVTGDFVEFRPYGEPVTLEASDPPAAVLVEAIQGRGGERVPPTGWFAALRAECDRVGALLIVDEIFTGFGRTGELFASGTERMDGVVPDLVTLGKGMTSGFPLSACVGTAAVMARWGRSDGESLHTSTFLGHPVGCAAALAVIDLFDHHHLLERARALGELMGETLGRLGTVRGAGALRGLVIEGDTMALCRRLLAKGYLVLPSGMEGEVLALSPALTMTEVQWMGAVTAIAESM